MQLRKLQRERTTLPKAAEAAASPGNPEEHFDHREEVTEDDWNLMNAEVKEALASIPWVDGLADAVQMSILFPERRSQIDLDDDVLSRLQTKISDEIGEKNWDKVIDCAYYLTMLFPENKSDEVDIESFYPLLIEAIQALGADAHLTEVSRLLVLFPRARRDLGLGEKDLKSIKEKMELAAGAGDWALYTDYAVDMRMIFPEQTAGFIADQRAIETLERTLEYSRRKKDNFLINTVIFSLTVLNAHSIRVDSDGIEFNNDHAPMPATPSLPDRNLAQ